MCHKIKKENTSPRRNEVTLVQRTVRESTLEKENSKHSQRYICKKNHL